MTERPEDDGIHATGGHWPDPDRPITSANQDVLGRLRFAKRVAAVVNEMPQIEESSVLAVVGPWGSGKSSVINLACAELETPDSSWIVRRARIWASPDVSGLIAEIFAAIRSALPEDGKASKAIDLLGKYAPLVTPALSLIPVVGKPAQGVADTALKLLADRQEQRPMQQLFEELTKELDQLDLCILVVLDDVDRLQPDELLMLFKAIRMVAPFPGVHYLLAYDEQTVIDILVDTPIARNSRDRALAYLEKIVQVPLAMPPVEYYYARKLLTDGLTDILFWGNPRAPFTEEQETRFRQLYTIMLHRTLAEPRAVNRFLRQVAAYLPLIDPDELDLIDLLALIHLRSFAPATYRMLARSKQVLTSSELLDAESSFRMTLYKRVTSECGDAFDEVWAGITELFPVLQENSGETARSIRVKLEVFPREKGKRVSIAEYFDRYFLLGLPITEVSDATAREALHAIASGELCEARTTIEERIHADDPAAVSAALRKLARFTEAGGFFDVVALGEIARYAIKNASLWRDSPLDEDVEAWTAAALARIAKVAPPVIPGLTDDLDVLGILRLCKAVDRAQLGARDYRAGFDRIREQVAGKAWPLILAHLRKGDRRLPSFPVASLSAFVAKSSIGQECAEELVADLDAEKYSVFDLAAYFVQVAAGPDGQEQVIGLDADSLIEFVGLAELGARCALSVNSADDPLPFDERDIRWEGRRKAGVSLLTAELQRRRAVPPEPPSGVLKRTEESVLRDKGPRRWANRPELIASSSAETKPLLCIRVVVLLPGGPQCFPSLPPTIEITDEQRAKIIKAILQDSRLTAWCGAITRQLGAGMAPCWEEAGWSNPSYAGFALTSAVPAEDPSPLPLHAFCAASFGPPDPGSTDGLALGLDLVVDMPFPAWNVLEGAVPLPAELGPSVTPWPSPELESLSGLVAMMTNAAIEATTVVTSKILKLDAIDGNIGIWLAATTPFGEILDLDQFPVVPGSGPGQNEVSAFARLPLEPGDRLDTSLQVPSVRGLAVHLIAQLLQQEQRRGYAETLHALRGPASR